MANSLTVYRNYADSGTLSSGTWSSTLPLSNLADRQLSKTARSQSLSTTATQFGLDFGSIETVKFVGALRHNLTQDGQWRIRLSTASDFATTEHDTGWQDIWPSIIPFGVGLWGEYYWGGKVDPAEASTYGIAAYEVIASPVRVRYMRIELDDAANPDGYLEAGRLIVAPAWEPTINLQYNWSLEQVDESRIVRSRGGQAYVDSKPKFRRLKFTLSDLQRDEMLGNAYELERLKGKGGDVLIMVDPDDAQHIHRQTVYGHLADTSAITNPYSTRFSKEFTIEELI